MRPRVAFFALVTLVPVPLLVLGALVGGIWIWGALAYLTLFTFLLDELTHFGADKAHPTQEFPAANPLSATLAVLHFPTMALGVWALAGATGLFNQLALFFAFGLFFGQVSNSNAHELIHQKSRPLFELGKWVFISHLFGHHTSAHRLVHHRHVGTKSDPNSARLGENLYHFVSRAWRGSFVQGLRAENARRRGKIVGSRQREWTLHPYAIYVAGAVGALVLAFGLAGLRGLLAYLAFASYASLQILMSDYVQHYGLNRKIRKDRSFEPVNAAHSWNAPHWFSSLLMLNAPRHSDHHTHPDKTYPALIIDQQFPTLPHSLAIMGFLALFPAYWRKIMDPLVSAWAGPNPK